jgi:hypothetical protein
MTTASRTTNRGGGRGAATRQPDLGAMAREAVVGFLHEASSATVQPQADGGTLAVGGVGAQAGAASAAALERIEALAAKVEADIAAALQTQAELEAGAGAAAEAAIYAAQSSWNAAAAAAESDRQTKISLRKVARYVTITIALLIITLLAIGLTATGAR